MTYEIGVQPSGLRNCVSVHMPIVIFLSFYFCLVVLGNLLYATPIGHEFLIGYPLVIYDFPETFSFGFWLLLFLPFLIVPPGYIITRVMFRQIVSGVANRVVVFKPLDYVILISLLFAFVVYSISKSGVFQLIGSGTDAVSSVETRFEILSRLGFATLVVLQSLLTYMSVLGLVSAMRSGRAAWWVLTFIAVAGTSMGLVILNMKWPIVVFYLSIMLTVFMFARRWVYVGTALCALTLVLVYLLISSFVFRLTTTSDAARPPAGITDQANSKPAANESSKPATNDSVPPSGQFNLTPDPSPEARARATPLEPESPFAPVSPGPAFEKIGNLFSTAFGAFPALARAVVVRMSFGFAYYYHVFTSEGPICGGVLEQARIGPKCRPSKLIYTRIFGADGFEGRGTSGAPVHISAYALGGWPLAIVALLATSVVLAGFSCLPLHGNATVAALRTVGAIAGYHFSQLPGEGVFLYDHGLLWLLLWLSAFALVAVPLRAVARKRSGPLRV